MFFYLYAIIELLAFFLDSAIIPTANVSYPVSGSVMHVKCVPPTCAAPAVVCCSLYRIGRRCLHLLTHQRLRRFPIRRRRDTTLIMGPYPLLHPSTTCTLTPPQLLRISTLVVFGVSLFVSIATFKKIAGFDYAKPIGLWIIYILWPLVCTVVYVVSQLVLVFRTLEDRWPIGDIVFGAAFFTVAQVILFAFSVTICDAIKHYIDGLFFFTLCMLLSVMMVYKYWDSITVRRVLLWLFECGGTDGGSVQREDLEFSVGSKATVWEVKDPLLAGGADYDEDSASNYTHGGPPASLVGGVSGKQLYQNGPGGRGYPPY